MYKRLAVSGHRPHKLPAGLHQAVRERLLEAVEGFQAQGGELLLHGGALGVDQWAAQAALSRGLPVRALLPHPGYSSQWAPQEREAVGRLLEAGEQRFVGSEASKASYLRRNDALLEECDVLLAVHSGAGWSGTKYTLTRALSRGLPVVEVVAAGGKLSSTFHRPSP